MKGILPENTATHRSDVVELGEQVCDALNDNYGVRKFVKLSMKDGLTQDEALVIMSVATATFCPHYHSEVEKVLDNTPS